MKAPLPARTRTAQKFKDATRALFLDEIGDIPGIPGETLRVLQDGVVERVGSSKTRQMDVRVVAATNRDLRERVDRGEFREDLYFRLEVLRSTCRHFACIESAALIKHFREKLGKKIRIDVPFFPEVVEAFRPYRWPGNVRELRHTLEQLFILANGDTITLRDRRQVQRGPVESSEFQLPPGEVAGGAGQG